MQGSQTDLAIPTHGTICEEYYGTSSEGGAEREEKTTSSNQINTTAHRANKEIWTPLMGWIKDPGTNICDEPNSDNSEERRQNCPLCYKRGRCSCAWGSDLDNSDAAAVIDNAAVMDIMQAKRTFTMSLGSSMSSSNLSGF